MIKLGEKLESNSYDYDYTLGMIDDILNDGKYEWSWDTVTGIHENIKKQRYVTEKQKTAINNIYYACEGRD
jgi:hypothetical protein